MNHCNVTGKSYFYVILFSHISHCFFLFSLARSTIRLPGTRFFQNWWSIFSLLYLLYRSVQLTYCIYGFVYFKLINMVKRCFPMDMFPDKKITYKTLYILENTTCRWIEAITKELFLLVIQDVDQKSFLFCNQLLSMTHSEKSQNRPSGGCVCVLRFNWKMVLWNSYKSSTQLPTVLSTQPFFRTHKIDGPLSIAAKAMKIIFSQDRDVQRLMDELDLPPDRANLFEVIDADGSGTLHITELVQAPGILGDENHPS